MGEQHKVIDFQTRRGHTPADTATLPDGHTVEWPYAVESRSLWRLRMLSSILAESYYASKNIIDHSVRISERLIFRDKYLPARLKQYRGQKRIAFLYHGYAQGRPGFERLERLLESDLFGVFAVSGGYQPYSQRIEKSAEYEAKEMEYVLSETNAREVYLVGHSQGGLIIRTMLQKMGLTHLIKRCVFLATPHLGTWAAVMGGAHHAVTRMLQMIPGFPRIDGESAYQMLPGSAFLRDLNSRPMPKGISYTSLYNYIDPMVWPASYARLPYPEAHNYLLMKIGHFQPIYDLQETEIIIRSLLLRPRGGQEWSEQILAGQDVIEQRSIRQEGHSFSEIVTSAD